MKTIIAAGGLVQNRKGEILFIFRLGKWDLPKGKVDKKEKIEEAALREVQEECGIGNLRIVRPMIKTFHNYELKGKQILKETHWFLMETNWKGHLIPQTEENITEVIWADKKKIKTLMKNTYDNIKELLSYYESTY